MTEIKELQFLIGDWIGSVQSLCTRKSKHISGPKHIANEYVGINTNVCLLIKRKQYNCKLLFKVKYNFSTSIATMF